MSRKADEHKFLTPLQEQWALPFELRPSGKMLKQAEKIHQQLRGTEPCKFCLSWTNADVFNLPDPGHDVRQEPLSAKIEGVHYTLLHKDEQLLPTIINRWQSWQHGFGAVQLDYNDHQQKMVVVHAKYCKAICPNGHYALPNGQQMHGKYEGNKAALMADMRALRARLLAVPSLEAVTHALFVPPAELPLPVPPARPVRRAVPPVEAFYHQVKDQPVDVSKPVMPKARWKPPALIPEPLSCVRYLTVPVALTPAHPGVFPPHPVFDLSIMPAHVPCEYTSGRPSAQVMALMLPGTGAALDKEQAQLDTVVVAHGFRPPLPPAPPSFVPMVTPPAPIGYVEGHRPLFLLDTSSKTMARKGRMGLMRDVLTALVQPGGEVRRYTQRFEVLLGGLEEEQPVPAWCKYTNTSAAACEAVEAGLASEDFAHHAGGRTLYDALKLAIRKTRPNNYWRQQQHALSDGIYLLSDGGGVAKGPLERMVATMCLTPQAVAIHCVALRPDARGRELLQYISGMTGGTYVECHAVDAPPPPPATPYSLLQAINSEDEMRALLNLVKQGEHTAYAPQGDGEVFSVLSPDWLGEERGRPASLEALLPSAPAELFEQQRQLQQFYAEWEDEDDPAAEAATADGGKGRGKATKADGATALQSIMTELEAMKRSNCPRHQAALLSEATGWVAAAVASRREANLQRHEESFERVDEMLRDPNFKQQYAQTFVGRYTRWVETVVALAYADHSGSTDQALGGQDFRKQWDSVSDMLAGVEGAPGDAKALALAAAKEADEQADEHGVPRWARADVMPDAPPDPNQERSDMLFACHNVTRHWLKLKRHYDLEAMRINQHHRGAVKAAMDAAMHGYLDSSLPAAPLQTPPDESSLPEPTLEQAAAAAKLQAAMEAVREKFSTQLCSLDLQLLELARAQGLPTDEQEAAKDSGSPALMKARNHQWAELLEVRLDRVAAIQSAFCEELAALLAADKVQFNAKAMEVRERNAILRERHSELLSEAAEGCRAVVAEAQATYTAIWEAHDHAAAGERGRAGGGVSAESSDASLAYAELATPLSKVDVGLGGRRSASRMSGRRSEASVRGGSMSGVRQASARLRRRVGDAEAQPPTPLSHAELCRASPLVERQHAASLAVSPAVRRRVGWAPTGGGHSSPEVIGRRQPSLYITNLIDTSPPSISITAAGTDKRRDVISPDNPFDLEEEAPRTPFTTSVASATPRSLPTTTHSSVDRTDSRQHSRTPLPPSPALTSASAAPPSTVRSRASSRSASARSLRASTGKTVVDGRSLSDAGGPTQPPLRRSLSLSRASSATGTPSSGSPRRSATGSSPRRRSPPPSPPPPPPVIEAAVVLRTVPPPPVSEASQAMYGERALAWRTDLHRVAEGFPELLEACWQYGVGLVAWRNQFNNHARDVGAQKLQNDALVAAEREYVEACAAWEAAVAAKTAEVRAKSARLIDHWRTAFLARLRALTPQVQAAEACAAAEGFRWAEAQGTPHAMRRSCHEDGAAVYDGMPLRYEIAMLGQAAARKRQADTELGHVHELILLMDNYGTEPPSGASAADQPAEQRMTLTEKIVDVVTWVYRAKNPFNGVQGHHNGFFDPRRAPCRLPRTPSPAPAPPPSSRAASPMPPPPSSSPPPLPRRGPSPLGRKLKPKPSFLLSD